MRPSVTVCLDKRRKSTTGDNKNKFPIKIKVNFKVREGKHNRYVVRRYQTGVFCRENDYAKAKNDPAVILALGKATELHQKGLSVAEFERLFTGSGGLEDIKGTFDFVISRLKEEERDGTALAYQNALNSFIKYKGEYISFASITVDWLKSYEKWMTRAHKKGEEIIPPHSINTVGMYCRALRTIFNMAIDLKIISRDLLPFGVRKYVIPSGQRKTRKAFSRDEKHVIFSHRSEREDVNRALDFWIFQYFANGCNMADVAYMKFKHIDGEWWRFERKKTENTEREKQAIDVYINERMREVIRTHANKSLNPESYVFPILKEDLSSAQRKSVIRDFIKDTNELLALAHAEINADRKKSDLPTLSVKLTSGTARYTAATELKRQGIDLAMIAKSLGHGSEATTEHYTEQGRETQILISKALAL